MRPVARLYGMGTGRSGETPAPDQAVLNISVIPLCVRDDLLIQVLFGSDTTPIFSSDTGLFIVGGMFPRNLLIESAGNSDGCPIFDI
ncbi:hypothetical protein [Haloquadratum walsbyi]|uniref:Uncharacterized protein n=1 Tax=Haloquadratum walsbyi J07HQW2 TaxID=1238425 RepID=U1MWU1_9EURY|nr:hypothetical protein [Haloquadratum walsbyi]ERG94894.1 MAG: hypothetical protein J07HQW2_01336 [Haloquadratum walsbyi J07HQW2]